MRRVGHPRDREDACTSAARANKLAEAIVEAARLTAHRVSLARTVRHASPLLLDVLAKRRIALGDVLDRLAAPPAENPSNPAAHWASYTYHHHRRRVFGAAPWLAGDPSAPLIIAEDEDLHLVRSGSQLGLFGSTGRLRLATAGATAWLWIEDALPATLALALVGRPVDALLSHALLTGHDYQVLSVEPQTRGRIGTVIHVRTGLRRCRTPWTPRQALDVGSTALLALISPFEP